MSGLAKSLKRGVLSASGAIGATTRVRDSEWRRRRLAILCYHGVSLDDEHEWQPAFYISPELFESRLRTLRDGGYTVLPLDEAVARLRDGTLPPRAVTLTFDDGAADFRLRALPILERYGFPSTVYLTTYYCGHPRPVFGVTCSYLLWRARGRVVDGGAVVPGAGRWDLTTAAGRGEALAALRAHVERDARSTVEKDALVARLCETLGESHDALVRSRKLQIMSPDDVRDVAARGVRIELHTHRHRTPRDPLLFRRELDDNRRSIVELGVTDPTHFCYPSGVYHSNFVTWLRDAGVRSATTCESGLAAPLTEPLLLPRIIDGGHLSAVEFNAWISGVGAMLPRRTAYRPED